MNITPMTVRQAIVKIKEMVAQDKYNSREQKRITFEPATKAFVVRLLQRGIQHTALARELGLTSTLIKSWEVLYREFDLTSEEGFADFLGRFDGRQLKYKDSQARTNYAETRRVGVVIEVCKEQSAVELLTAKIKEHQQEIARLTMQLELVKKVEELGMQVTLK